MGVELLFMRLEAVVEDRREPAEYFQKQGYPYVDEFLGFLSLIARYSSYDVPKMKTWIRPSN